MLGAVAVAVAVAAAAAAAVAVAVAAQNVGEAWDFLREAWGFLSKAWDFLGKAFDFLCKTKEVPWFYQGKFAYYKSQSLKIVCLKMTNHKNVTTWLQTGLFWFRAGQM